MVAVVVVVVVLKPAAATPHGHVAFVRSGAEACAKRTRDFATSAFGLLVIVEGRARKITCKT